MSAIHASCLKTLNNIGAMLFTAFLGCVNKCLILHPVRKLRFEPVASLRANTQIPTCLPINPARQINPLWNLLDALAIPRKILAQMSIGLCTIIPKAPQHIDSHLLRLRSPPCQVDSSTRSSVDAGLLERSGQHSYDHRRRPSRIGQRAHCWRRRGCHPARGTDAVGATLAAGRYAGAARRALGATAHAVGWPVPRGGSQSITNALCSYLGRLGGVVKTDSRVGDLSSMGEFKVALCDVTPKQLLQIAGPRFTPAYQRLLQHYRYGPGIFKVDYALSSPIPWKAADCARAITVHLGGTIEEIAASEDAMSKGRHAEKPFVLLAQPTLYDTTRAPAGKHIVWAYCHVPNGSTFDMLPRLEAQIERFAPGFRDCVLARRVFKTADLEAMDANLVGGDIGGGAVDLLQFLLRPTWRQYATSASDVFICSSSTPPGGGVHGMCGYNAAKLALKRLAKG